MIPGIELSLGDDGRKYIIPPLKLGSLESLQDRLATVTQGQATDPRNIATVIDAAHAALQRNYPELTRDQVADMLDLGNMSEVLSAVLDVSGVKRKAAIAGETKPQTAAPAAG